MESQQFDRLVCCCAAAKSEHSVVYVYFSAVFVPAKLAQFDLHIRHFAFTSIDQSNFSPLLLVSVLTSVEDIEESSSTFHSRAVAERVGHSMKGVV